MFHYLTLYSSLLHYLMMHSKPHYLMLNCVNVALYYVPLFYVMLHYFDIELFGAELFNVRRSDAAIY